MTRKQIKDLRRSMNMTQEKFAAKVGELGVARGYPNGWGVVLSTVQTWEAGSSKPGPLAMAVLQKLVNTDVTSRLVL